MQQKEPSKNNYIRQVESANLFGKTYIYA